MSPLWGFKTFGFPTCYKHVAPLGLKTGSIALHPSIIHMSPRWGFKTFGFPACYKHDAPLGLKTWKHRTIPRHDTYRRPAGALRLLGFLRAINMSPRWG